MRPRALLLLAFAVSAFAPAGPVVPVARGADAAAVDLAADGAAAWFRDEHFEVLCGGRKIGWMRRSLTRTEFGGVKAVAREVETRIDASGDGDGVSTRTRTTFAAEGAQPMLAARTERTELGRSTSREVVRNGLRFDVVTERRGERVTGTVQAFDVALADELGIERLAAAAAARTEGPVGASVTVTSIDFVTLAPLQRTMTCTAAPEVDGARRFEVSVVVGPTRETARVDASGGVDQGSLGPRFAYRRVRAEEATAPVDASALAALARIPMDGKLGPPSRVRKLVVAWDAAKGRVFLRAPNQTIAVQGDALVVQVLRDGETAPVDEDSYRDGLADEPGLDLSDPEIARAVAAMLRDTPNRAQQVGLLVARLAKSMRKEVVPGTATAKEILLAGAGDASEHVRLFVAWCRAAGIPARAVHGLAWQGDEAGVFVWHAWAEVALDGHWTSADPMLGLVPAPATNIRADASAEARTLLWGAKFRLVEVDRDEPPPPQPPTPTQPTPTPEPSPPTPEPPK